MPLPCARVHRSSRAPPSHAHSCPSLAPPCADLDTDGDGIISSSEMVAMLRNKLPKAEVSPGSPGAGSGAAGAHFASLRRHRATCLCSLVVLGTGGGGGLVLTLKTAGPCRLQAVHLPRLLLASST